MKQKQKIEKMAKLEGFEKKQDHFYFLADRDDGKMYVGEVGRAKGRGDDKPKDRNIVVNLNMERDKKYLYFIKGFDDGHYVCRQRNPKVK